MTKKIDFGLDSYTDWIQPVDHAEEHDMQAWLLSQPSGGIGSYIWNRELDKYGVQQGVFITFSTPSLALLFKIRWR